MIRVLAIDPGERVGWAAGNCILDTSQDPDTRLDITAHGILFLKDAALQIHNAVVVEDRIDVLIYESFILTRKGAQVMVGSDLQTAQLVGMCRLAAWLNPRVKLIEQRPAAMSSARKSLTGPHPSAADVQERIRKLPKSHDDSHDGSALLHLWHYFFERYV
jgi:hypothetical protein